jgi:hypothetical protein
MFNLFLSFLLRKYMQVLVLYLQQQMAQMMKVIAILVAQLFIISNLNLIAGQIAIPSPCNHQQGTGYYRYFE